MTIRLYYDDSSTLSFDARIIEQTEYKGRPAVMLDQTYFYPEGGGQPFDTGTLNGIRVVEVQNRAEDRAVLHILDTPLDGEQAHGVIDTALHLDPAGLASMLQIAANVGALVFVIASLHLLYLNTHLLPAALRPPLWRRVALVLMALFYGAFLLLSLRSLV